MLNAQVSLGVDNGNERAKLPVISSSGLIQQNGNYTITQGVDFSIPARELFLSNDSSANITIQVICQDGELDFLLLPGETINERLPIFNKVIVTSSGLWRFYIRGNFS